MDKGSEYLGKGRSNGTKSPSNASNGHFSDESGSEDEHGIASNTHFACHTVHVLFWTRKTENVSINVLYTFFLIADVGMRVGSDYQANIPEFDPGKVMLDLPDCILVVASV
jgi:hypothetical protein